MTVNAIRRCRAVSLAGSCYFATRTMPEASSSAPARNPPPGQHHHWPVTNIPARPPTHLMPVPPTHQPRSRRHQPRITLRAYDHRFLHTSCLTGLKSLARNDR